MLLPVFQDNLSRLIEGVRLSEVTSFDLHGLERELFRVREDATIAQTPHPLQLGDKLYNPYVTTDFSESQLELVTPPCSSIDQAYNYLVDLIAAVKVKLDKSELLWPCSMPPIIELSNIPLADYGTSHQGKIKHLYRRGLANRYGVNMQAISGIHYNFSFTDDFWRVYFQKPYSQADLNEAYFSIIRNFKRYGWLLIYLFGASPFAHDTFYRNDVSNPLLHFREDLRYPEARSLRSSHLGYFSAYQSRHNYSYNSLESYLEALYQALNKPEKDFFAFSVPDEQLSVHLLQIENELYSDIRPKAVDTQSRAYRALKEKGVNYLEIRNIDINPFLVAGVSKQSLTFLKIFLWYCLLQESSLMTSEDLHQFQSYGLLIAEFSQDPLFLKNQMLEGGLSFYSQGMKILSDCLLLAESLESVMDFQSQGFVSAVQLQIDQFQSNRNVAQKLIEQRNEQLTEERVFSTLLYDYNVQLEELARSDARFTSKAFQKSKESSEQDLSFEKFFEEFMFLK